MGLGRLTVSGRSRVPSPPTRIIAFMIRISPSALRDPLTPFVENVAQALIDWNPRMPANLLANLPIVTLDGRRVDRSKARRVDLHLERTARQSSQAVQEITDRAD